MHRQNAGRALLPLGEIFLGLPTFMLLAYLSQPTQSFQEAGSMAAGRRYGVWGTFSIAKLNLRYKEVKSYLSGS